MNDHATLWGKFVKALDWIAVVLGIGTVVGLVNLVVGVLSGAWIAVQLYGYWRYELPMKRAKLKRVLAEVPTDMRTGPGDLL
jgi:ABC-type lipoprotein release transport system permease subunit